MTTLLSLVLVGVLGQADVRNTRHNLSATSSNTVRAQSETQVCVFCHVPHGASQSRAIWNRDLGYQAGGNLYTLYGSSTLEVPPNRPNGTTRLCLSCHDGALALGSLLNLEATRPASVAMQSGVTTMPAGPRNLGTDLRNDHPVSLPIPSTDPEVVAPPNGDAVKLHAGATAAKDSVQCTSCHDPHLATPKFLVKSNLRGALCLTCHPKQGWLGSRHEASAAPYPATGAQTVGDLGCLACHKPHNGEGPTKLLTTQNLSATPAQLARLRLAWKF